MSKDAVSSDSEISDDMIRAKLLHRLDRRRAWTGKHAAYEHWLGGFSQNLRARVKEQAGILVRQNLVVMKPAHYGLQVYLNSREKPYIRKLIADAGFSVSI